MEDQCYLWPSNKENWIKAEEYCQNKGGHLASVTNERIHEYIRSKIDQWHHETRFLVGGTDRDEEGKWKWTDGSHWDFENWAFNQPDDRFGGEDCLQVWPWQQGWNDVGCNKEIKFVCSQRICPGDHTTNNEKNTMLL